MTESNPAPEATNTLTLAPETPSAPVDPAQELEALKAKYSKAQADLAKFRTRQDEVTAAQKAAEEKALAEADATKRAELLTVKVAELEKASAEAAARATAAERRAALAGRVVDPTAALKLLDDTRHLDGDGNIDTDKLLVDYPFLAPGKLTGAPATPGAGGTLNGKATTLTALQERLEKARSREERIALQDEILKVKKG